ncbi:Xaa-Pro dipeptidase [Pseudomarimonas salicorniae]|uniref:Xaa-Pro dipeptidase n=1 Tax=Pseudomarimonas salicorniae TaxID=2933270 RepID=A0ABT0GLW4_9GAMM|nr:Xaa-Pro dipeptidase [Lysobacter sp. CAU 1642]MCK7595534.1 Xaa-Pro dipeptidase [Lysobacter sp. CAU 1642]
MTASPADLYADHVARLQQRCEAALARSGHDHLLIASGVEKYHFLDDRPYPFAANPHFKAWLPLDHHPGCWLRISPGQRPRLAYLQPDDFWHLPPEAPGGYWAEHFDVEVIRSPAEAMCLRPASGRLAILGEADAALEGLQPNNPEALVNYLHFHRGYKSGYEIACMREASRRAVRGHRAAEAAFREGLSERDIHRAYLVATGHGDLDLPYGSIVALNRHAAVLHYQHQQAEVPAESRSFLIDAGASHAGYAADITRSYARASGRFADLIGAVDVIQRALCDQVRDGADYAAIHLDTHRRLAGLLRDAGIVDMDPESQLEQGVSATFFPHGVGHLIGLQVHDVAGLQIDEEGTRRERPEGHPFLRLTRTLGPGMAVTIEPGLYFIPSLLDRLRSGPHSRAVNWQAIEALLPFGGIRIEDDVVCTEAEPLNLTREAFAEAA